MSSLSEFYEAAVPEPYVILGLRLKPLSLGHLILLHKLESPFVSGGDAMVGDLAIAALICSMNFEDAISMLDDPKLPGKIQKWGYRLTHQVWWKPWKHTPLDAEKLGNLFREYIDYHSKPPAHMMTGDDGKSIGAPYPQLVKIHLHLKTNLTESEILNRFWRLCLWDLLTIKALEGQLEFVDEDEISEYQRLADEFAQRLEQSSKTN